VKAWFTSVGFDGAGKGWITFDDGLLMSEDGGDTWKPVSTSRRFFLSKLFRVKESMWAIGQSALLRQTEGTWKRIDTLVPGGAPVPGTQVTRP